MGSQDDRSLGLQNQQIASEGDVVSCIVLMRARKDICMLNEMHTGTIRVFFGVTLRWRIERRWEAMYRQGCLVQCS